MREIYQIYIEYIFLLNFVFLYCVWSVSLALVFCSVTQKKLVLASLGGALIASICLVFPIILWVRLFLGSVSAFWFSYRILIRTPQNKQKVGKYLSITFLVAILLGGCMGILQKRMGEASFSFWQISLFLLLISFLIKKILQRCLPQRQRVIYDVALCVKGREYRMKGLLDTGNSLVEPISKKPVCIISREYFDHCIKGRELQVHKEAAGTEDLEEFLAEKLRVIPYHSVGKENGVMFGYEMEGLVIDGDKEKVIIEKPIIGISDVEIGSNKSYQMILQPELLREGEN